MGLIEKTPSNEEYHTLKEKSIEAYKHLIIDYPFEPAETLQKKWSEMQKQLKQVYNLSQKYIDTESDIPVLKAYVDDAEKRCNEYSYENTYSKFRAEYLSVVKEHEALLEDTDLWYDNKLLAEKFEKQYKSSGSLLRRLPGFKSNDIDERLLKDVYSNSTFYYCIAVLEYTDGQEGERNASKRDSYLQSLKNILTASKNLNEKRFKVIAGITCFRLALFSQESADIYGRSDGNASEVESYSGDAKSYLGILETGNYCLNVTKKYSPSLVLPYMEWKYMVEGLISLINIYEYENNISRARDICNNAINVHQDGIGFILDEEKRQLVIDKFTSIRDELSYNRY